MKNDKIRILHVVLSMETGGLENGIVNLVNHSDQENFCVDVLCLREKGELAARIDNPNSHVKFSRDKENSIYSAVKKVISANKESPYDIIHSHGFTTMLACWLAGFFSKSYIQINGEHGTLYYGSLKKRLIQKFLFSRMALNLSVSENLKNLIIDKFNITKNNFLPIINGVNTSKFTNDNPSETKQEYTPLHDLKIPMDDIIIGSVGRLVAIKNYHSLIEAFTIVSQSHKNCHLVLAGDGPERKELENQIKKNTMSNRIHLLGRRDDVPILMKQFDIFVLPSFSEGLSNTILEAMSCGTPVVASNVGGNKEIVIEGVTGHLYSSNNITDLAFVLDDLVSNPYKIKQLAKESRLHILKNHSIESMVSNYEDTYQKLLFKKNNFFSLEN